MKSVTDLMEAIFDKHYKGDPSIAFGEVTRAFALNHLEIPEPASPRPSLLYVSLRFDPYALESLIA